MRFSLSSRSVAAVAAAFLAAGGLAAHAADPLESAVSGYARYKSAVNSAVSSLPRSTTAIKQSTRDLAAVPARDLGMAWIANLALDASSSPAFIAGVQRAAAAEGSPARLADRLLADRTAVMSFAGAAEAYERAVSSVRQDDIRMAYLAGALEDIARGRSVRAAPAGAVAIPRPRPARGTIATSVSATAVTQEQVRKLPAWSAGTADKPSVVIRMMNLAALRVLGESSAPGRSGDIARLLDDPAISSCLGWAQVNLNQCSAASRGGTEMTFCAYTHAVEDVSKCFNWIIGGRKG